MATYPILVSDRSKVQANQAADTSEILGTLLVQGDVIIRGGEEVDSRETLMPLVTAPGVAGFGGEALRFDTTTPATGANPIMHGGYTQYGSQCWTGAASVFGAGMRLTPRIDTQAAGVPATYHLEIGDQLGVEKWRISEAGVVTQKGALLFDADATHNIGATGATRPLNVYAAGTHYGQRSALAGVTAPAFSADNLTDAVAAPGNIVQVSPAYHRRGHAWNSVGGASETHDWIDWVLPATAAGATSSTWKLQRSLNGAAYADIFTIGSDGQATLFGDLLVRDAATAIKTGDYTMQFQSGKTATGGVDVGYIFDVPAAIGAGDFHTRWGAGGGTVASLDGAGGFYGLSYDAIQAALHGTTVMGLSARNATAATAIDTIEVSPYVYQRGSAWNSLGAVSESHEWYSYVLPATAAGATASTWRLMRSLNGAAYGEMFSVTSGGLGTFAGNVNATGAMLSGNVKIDMPGAGVNSPTLDLTGDNGGTEITARMQLMFGADPYLRIGVSPDGGTTAPTSVIDIHDTVIAGVTDGAVSWGATGANRFGSMFITGSYNVERSALGATTVDGLLLRNTTLALVGATVQVSPSLNFESHVWATVAAVSDGHLARLTLVPVSAATTSSVLSFQFRKDPNEVAGAYGAAAMTLSSGGLLTTTYGAFTSVNIGSLYFNTVYPLSVGAMGFQGLPAATPGLATSVSFNFANHGAYQLTIEGARMMTIGNSASVPSASIDKNGVYWNAYGSGQIVAATSKAVTLVTTCDDDSTYIVEYYACVNDQAATPASQAVWFGQGVYDRIDGTLTRRTAGTPTELYDGAAAFTCADAVSGNSIVVTVTGTGGTTVNVKVWGVRIMKCGSAALGAGVAYPLAA